MKYFVLMLAICLGACATDRPYSASNAADSTVIVEQDYILAPSDKVRVLVYNEPTLSGEYSVAPNGSIAFPLIGEVPTKGKTTEQLGAAIRTRLAEGFVRSPNVSVEVLSFRPFYVLGEVNKSGQYPYVTGMTVLQAIASAEGFTYRANKSFIFVRRAGSAEEIKVPITASLTVHPGDTIRIAERYF